MITDILPAAFSALGVDAPDRIDIGRRVGAAKRIVVVLVDGLGYHLLQRAAQSAPFFADLGGGRLDELASTLPSTTPTSLVSFGTGALPGDHGILGFTLNVPGTDRVLTHIFWRDDPPPHRWQPVPTWFARAATAGVESAVVLPAVFAGSGLTIAAYSGARFVGLARADDPVAGIRGALDGGARLVFGYTAAIDTAAHIHGIASREWAAACAAAGRLLERLVEVLPPDVALLVTADHGGLDIPADTRIDIADDPRLTAGLRVIAGEPRFRHLHTTPGATRDVLATWRELLGNRADVLTRDDAVASGLFGTVRASHLARIGDVVAIARADAAILASGHEPAEVAALVGMHGAREPVETAVPLISLSAR